MFPFFTLHVITIITSVFSTGAMGDFEKYAISTQIFEHLSNVGKIAGAKLKSY